MTDYMKLTKFFYIHGATKHQLEYEQRFNNYAAYQTGLTIHPFRKGMVENGEIELFFVHVPELMALHEKVLENSILIRQAVSELPKFAVEPYFHKLIVNEAQSNNEIEGVRSTKEELTNILEHLHDSKNISRKRFVGMMKTYQFIDQLKPFTSIQDFRVLYDQLVADEVSKKKEPDGEYFRKTGVTITDGSKITHRGVEPEAKIIEKLTDLVHFLQSEAVPDLYKYFIAHYYYEYIHPFYDGNGRTGRLLVGSYVARKLERYSAITLSYTVNNDKPKYYKALEMIANPFNKGDMTFYLIDMVELLVAGQKELLEDLLIVLAKSKRIKEFIDTLDWIENNDLKHLLHIMLDIEALATSIQPLSNTQLKNILGISSHLLKKYLEELEARSIVRVVRKRPKTYQIEEEFLQEIFN
ncbi:Fic family protein [Planococcus glaciei]|uniref:Fic family protein n=1 Tax=Planococcus glaciei TaxID=459472 RepID=UPI001F29FEFF|nr:Fic family protein [Planococcus glaciei]